VIGAFVAAALVALGQYVRSRDRRLLPLTAMLAFQAFALSRPGDDVWGDVFQLAVCLAGLLLVLVLSMSPAPPSKG